MFLEIFMKVWYFIAILPYLILSEGHVMLVKFLKKRGIEWDMWYSLLLVLLVFLVVLFFMGF